MYVAVKGGERAIQNSHKLIAEQRRGGQDVPVFLRCRVELERRQGEPVDDAAAEAYEREAPSRPAGRPGGPPSSAASAATTAVAAAWATSDIASIADVVSPFPSRSPSRATLVEDTGEQPGQGGGDR